MGFDFVIVLDNDKSSLLVVECANLMSIIKPVQKATRLLYDLFENKIAKLPKDLRSSMAVALSGGPDSMALAYIGWLYSKNQTKTRNLEDGLIETKHDLDLFCDSEQRSLYEFMFNTENGNLLDRMKFYLMKKENQFQNEWPLERSGQFQKETPSERSPKQEPQSLFSESFRFIAFIVDHGLRNESFLEAEKTFRWARSLGIESIVLKLEWKGQIQKQKLLESARDARYALMIEKCNEQNISTLLVGHHAGRKRM